MSSRLSQPPMSLVEWERFNIELQALANAVWRRLPEEQQFTSEFVLKQQEALVAFRKLRPRPLHAVPTTGVPEWGWQGT